MEQTFILHNTSPQPILITRLRAACGCTSLLLADAGRTETQATIKPGGQTQVRMTLRVQGQSPGELHKYAWVYGEGDTPLATLAINITVRPAASFSPAIVDFGTVAQGMAQTVMLSVTVDASAVAAAPFPTLVSTNSDVQVSAEGSPQPTQRDGQPSLVQRFQVVLTSHAPVGLLTGQLFLSQPHTPQTAPGTVASSPPPKGTPTPLFDLIGGVTGQITGRLAATPQSLFFGSLPSGRAATRQVVLTLAPASAESLTATSGSPWLSAHLLPASASPPGMRLLAVTLDPLTPVGPLEAQVVVEDAAGQRLILPVIADLTATR